MMGFRVWLTAQGYLLQLANVYGEILDYGRPAEKSICGGPAKNRMNDIDWRRALRLGFAFGIVALLLPRLIEAASVNLWSIRYHLHTASISRGAAEVPPPPEGHARAPLWLAREAIEAGEPELALELVKEVYHSADLNWLRVQGEALAAAGDFEGAVNTWVRAEDFQSLLKSAQESEIKGLLENAEIAYEGAWQVNPLQGTLPLANFYRHQRDDPTAAERVLRQSLAAYQPTHLSWLRSLGLALEAQSGWDEALAVYSNALNLKPDDIKTLRLIGFAYYHGKGDYDAALRSFESMIEIAPAKGDGFFATGQLMAKEGRYDEAEQWFIQALMRDPDRPIWWVVRADTARQAQNFSLALDTYSEAIHRYPDYALLYYEMAWAYKLYDRPERAVDSIEAALARQVRPNGWYYVRAGLIYEWVYKRESAIEAYRRAIEFDPTNHLAIQAALNGLQRLEAGRE